MEEKKDWVDFKKVKEVSFERVLETTGLIEGMRREGDEFIGSCPLHNGKENESFYANVEKGLFQCFACKKKGNVLDFVKLYQKGSLKEAGLWLQGLLDEKTNGDSVEKKDAPAMDGLEKKLDEVFFLLLSIVEEHIEKKDVLAKKLTRAVMELV